LDLTKITHHCHYVGKISLPHLSYFLHGVAVQLYESYLDRCRAYLDRWRLSPSKQITQITHRKQTDDFAATADVFYVSSCTHVRCRGRRIPIVSMHAAAASRFPWMHTAGYSNSTIPKCMHLSACEGFNLIPHTPCSLQPYRMDDLKINIGEL
jgi:hypothetical protein